MYKGIYYHYICATKPNHCTPYLLMASITNHRNLRSFFTVKSLFVAVFVGMFHDIYIDVNNKTRKTVLTFVYTIVICD